MNALQDEFARIDARVWLQQARDTFAAMDRGEPIDGVAPGTTDYYPVVTGRLRAVAEGLAKGLDAAMGREPQMSRKQVLDAINFDSLAPGLLMPANPFGDNA